LIYIFFQDSNSIFIDTLLFFHDHIMSFVSFITVFVFILITRLTNWKSNSTIKINIHLIEIIWTIIPFLILVCIAIPSIQALYYMEDYASPSVTVKTIGNQWFWSYEYGGLKRFDSYIKKDNSLYRIVDTNNSLTLPYSFLIQNLITSSDVIHSWAVPALGVKTDAIPGRVNQSFFILKNPGLYYGQCSEICGANHSFMPICLEVTFPSLVINYLKNI